MPGARNTGIRFTEWASNVDILISQRNLIMNKDQVKGTAKDVAGKVQEEAGKLTGSKEQQAKGLSKQVEGKTQKSVGDVKEAIKDSTKKS
jgi:uncharacterized protein YjbJ (UPF0337 family)